MLMDTFPSVIFTRRGATEIQATDEQQVGSYVRTYNKAQLPGSSRASSEVIPILGLLQRGSNPGTVEGKMTLMGEYAPGMFMSITASSPRSQRPSRDLTRKALSVTESKNRCWTISDLQNTKRQQEPFVAQNIDDGVGGVTMIHVKGSGRQASKHYNTGAILEWKGHHQLPSVFLLRCWKIKEERS
jgi:hypothetical protein